MLISVTEPMMTDSPASVLFESIIDGVNAYYSVNLALEVEKEKAKCTQRNEYKWQTTSRL